MEGLADPVSDVPEPRPKIFGKYRLLSLLGRGAFSTVYRAELHSSYGFRKRVAIKVMRRRLSSTNEPASQEFLNEARLGAAVQHPNLVEFYECGRVGDRLYIAMELVEGPSLAELVKVSPNLGMAIEDDVVLAVAMQCARGLRALHTAVVDDQPIQAIHRDLKPGNILLSPAGQAKLTDYGVARYATDTYETITADGPLGSPLYMSPEQARGQELTQASDIFSYGTTILELINGRPVFGSSTIEGVVRNVDRGDVGDALMGARARFPTLVPVLENCLLTDPSNRIAHGSALVEALKDVDPPPFADEQVASLASQVFSAVEFQREALRRNPIEQFWSKLGDDEDSVSVPIQPEPEPDSAGLDVEDDEDSAGEDGFARGSRRWKGLVTLLLLAVLALMYWNIQTQRSSGDDGEAVGDEPDLVVDVVPDHVDLPREAGTDLEPATSPSDDGAAGHEEAIEDPTQAAVIPPETIPEPVVAPALPTALEHAPVSRGIRGQATALPATVAPAGRTVFTLWFRAAPSGAWQTRAVEGGDGGAITLTIPTGAWLPEDARDVDYFIEMSGADGVVRSGSAARPHRLTLY
jgi:serine/threonine protein kinase